MKVAIDTNIVIDILLNRKGSTEALSVLELARQKRIEVYVASHSITDVWYITTQSFKIPARKVREKLNMLLTIVSVLPCSRESFQKAVNDHSADLEDQLIQYSALESRCDYTITNDKKMLKSDVIPSLSPSQFLGQIA